MARNGDVARPLRVKKSSGARRSREAPSARSHNAYARFTSDLPPVRSPVTSRDSERLRRAWHMKAGSDVTLATRSASSKKSRAARSYPSREAVLAAEISARVDRLGSTPLTLISAAKTASRLGYERAALLF